MTATVQRRAWMQDLCGDSPRTEVPFRCAVRGVDVDIATNGQALVMMRGATAFAAVEHAPTELEVAKIVAAERSPGVPVAFEDLRDWAFPDRKCATCAGSGECQDTYPCGCSVDLPCGDCRGSGRSSMVRGRLFGRLVNRALLYRYLSRLSASMVRVSLSAVEDQSIRIECDEWELHLMPMIALPNSPPEELVDFPGAP